MHCAVLEVVVPDTARAGYHTAIMDYLPEVRLDGSIDWRPRDK